jgi:hypothetical protein
MASDNLAFQLPAALRHEALAPCPVQELVHALKRRADTRDIEVNSRFDALTDEVHALSAEVRELALDLRTSVKRSEALNVEMGLQLKRYAEYTDRNLKQDERGAALEKRLTSLVAALHKVAGSRTKGKAKK